MTFLFYKNSSAVASHGEVAWGDAYIVHEGPEVAATSDTSDESQVGVQVTDVWKEAFGGG